MSILISILIFFVILVLLILVHEFGHFIVAKRAGIRVDEFGIGFPPKLFGKRVGETEYTINALPIGGFVRIFGEDPTDEHTTGLDAARSFVSKPRIIQAAVLVAGVTMNVLFAWLLFTIGFMTGMPTAVSSEEVDTVRDVRLLIVDVQAGSPAADALKPGDEIQSLRAGEAVLEGSFSPAEVGAFTAAREGEEVVFSLIRRGEPVTATVVPQKGVLATDAERVAGGFSLDLIGIKRYPWYRAIYEGAQSTLYALQRITVDFGTFVVSAVRGQAQLEQISGPVGIVGYVDDAASLGFAWLITFSAFISLNLALINILPFPALDGGRLLFVAIEAVIRRPIKPVIANTLNRVGFALLILLMVAVTWSDIVKLL